MWIAIEGPTCSGKSTLEQALTVAMTDPARSENKPLKQVHFGPPADKSRRGVLREYVLNWEADQSAYDILADRWHWGEVTYSPLYRPETNKDGFGLLGEAGWRWTELFLMSRGALTVYLRANADTLRSRLLSRGDDQVRNVDELMRVASLYDQAFPLAPSATHAWDTSTVNREKTEAMTRLLVTAAQQLEDKTQPIREFRGYIGRPDPAVLLVGDTRNVTKRHGEETKLPFMPVDGNSGDYLMRALPDYMWPSVGIVNANEYPHSLKILWDRLGNPPVVALGNNARDALKRQKVPHKAVHHPQYARRFAYHSIDSYGKQLATAAQQED